MGKLKKKGGLQFPESMIEFFLLLGSVRLAQLDRAFGYGPKGRGFESSNARAKCIYYIL